MPKILVICDRKDSLILNTLILKREGFDPIQAENGLVGLQIAQEHHPDLIVCDTIMALVLDGWGVLGAIKKDPTLSGIPFIFLSARGDEHYVARAFEIGVADFLSMPWTPKQLVAAIRKQLKLT